MKEIKRLQAQLNENTYKDLELFCINNTNFTEVQAGKFINLLERINNDSKEIKLKNSKISES